MKSKYRYFSVIFTLLLLVISIGVGFAAEGYEGYTMQSTSKTPFVVLRADPGVNQFHVPAPPGSLDTRAEDLTATISIVYLQNEYDAFGYWCDPWPAEAKAAFDAAASIWGSILNSTVLIKAHACWTGNLNPGILGGSATDSYWRDFTNAPMSNTWYSVSLANALSGSDRNGSDPEMHHVYNKNFDWYFGTDGNTPGNMYDFMTTVLHEMGHGLGFEGSMTVEGGLGYWGWNQDPNPAIYDRFTENGSGQELLSFTNGSTTLANQLTGNNVYFDGMNANSANGGQRPELYAPSSWSDGSSYSHLGEVFNNTLNALMTYSMGKGESVHDPGPVTRGILKDIGWQEFNTPPSISGLPDQFVPMNIGGDNLIDLWAYASDNETASSGLTYTIDNSPPAGAGVVIDANRYVDITPAGGWTGTAEVRIRVSDPGGLSDTDTFNLTLSLIWDGSSSANWHTASNWTPAVVPDATHLVTIPMAANQPVISGGSAQAGDLVIQQGASLDLGEQQLSVEGSLANHGTLKQTAGVSGITTTQFLRIKDVLGLETAYYGIDITPEVGFATDVTVSVSGNQLCSRLVPGIRRCFTVSPQGSLSATVRFYFTDDELDGNSLTQLNAFLYSGGSWIEEPGPYHYPAPGDVKYVEVENVDEYSQFGLSAFVMDDFFYLPLAFSNAN